MDGNVCERSVIGTPEAMLGLAHIESCEFWAEQCILSVRPALVVMDANVGQASTTLVALLLRLVLQDKGLVLLRCRRAHRRSALVDLQPSQVEPVGVADMSGHLMSALSAGGLFMGSSTQK